MNHENNSDSRDIEILSSSSVSEELGSDLDKAKNKAKTTAKRKVKNKVKIKATNKVTKKGKSKKQTSAKTKTVSMPTVSMPTVSMPNPFSMPTVSMPNPFSMPTVSMPNPLPNPLPFLRPTFSMPNPLPNSFPHLLSFGMTLPFQQQQFLHPVTEQIPIPPALVPNATQIAIPPALVPNPTQIAEKLYNLTKSPVMCGGKDCEHFLWFGSIDQILKHFKIRCAKMYYFDQDYQFLACDLCDKFCVNKAYHCINFTEIHEYNTCFPKCSDKDSIIVSQDIPFDNHSIDIPFDNHSVNEHSSCDDPVTDVSINDTIIEMRKKSVCNDNEANSDDDVCNDVNLMDMDLLFAEDKELNYKDRYYKAIMNDINNDSLITTYVKDQWLEDNDLLFSDYASFPSKVTVELFKDKYQNFVEYLRLANDSTLLTNLKPNSVLDLVAMCGLGIFNHQQAKYTDDFMNKSLVSAAFDLESFEIANLLQTVQHLQTIKKEIYQNCRNQNDRIIEHKGTILSPYDQLHFDTLLEDKIIQYYWNKIYQCHFVLQYNAVHKNQLICFDNGVSGLHFTVKSGSFEIDGRGTQLKGIQIL